jgi:hypothetical protein
MPNTRWRQVLPPLAFSVGLAALRIWRLPDASLGDVGGDLLVLATMNAVGVLMVWRRTELEAGESASWTAAVEARLDAERALGELRTLYGIIPICAHCKRVRTEEGAWEGLERFVRDRTDAEFSHGICPNCLSQHYPDLSADEHPAR